jgi:hypothetical protein
MQSSKTTPEKNDLGNTLGVDRTSGELGDATLILSLMQLNTVWSIVPPTARIFSLQRIPNSTRAHLSTCN